MKQTSKQTFWTFLSLAIFLYKDSLNLFALLHGISVQLNFGLAVLRVIVF